jgi:transposase-like protein
MGQAVGVQSKYTSTDLRGLAKRCRNADQARRLLSIAAVVDGASRAVAAKLGGMDRQTLRDWVHRFNEKGPDGLINHPAPGASPKLSKGQQAKLAVLVAQARCLPSTRSCAGGLAIWCSGSTRKSGMHWGSCQRSASFPSLPTPGER